MKIVGVCFLIFWKCQTSHRRTALRVPEMWEEILQEGEPAGPRVQRLFQSPGESTNIHPSAVCAQVNNLRRVFRRSTPVLSARPRFTGEKSCGCTWSLTLETCPTRCSPHPITHTTPGTSPNCQNHFTSVDLTCCVLSR